MVSQAEAEAMAQYGVQLTGESNYNPSAQPQLPNPLPINMLQSNHVTSSFDPNSYDDAAFPLDGYSYGTPSYAGSFGSQASNHSDSFYAPANAFQTSGNNLLDPNTSKYNPFLAYRDDRYEYHAPSSEHDSDGASIYGGTASEAGDSVAGSIGNGLSGTGNNIDFDFDPRLGVTPDLNQQNEFSSSRSQSPFGGIMLAQPIRTDSDPLAQNNKLNSIRNQPNSTSFLFPSDSSAGNAPEFKTSPPSLTPLSIPTDNGPNFNLIQPTPHTARPKSKGANTLELERLLGMNEWDTKREPSGSFSDFTPNPSTKNSIGPGIGSSLQPLFTNTLSGAPESLDTPVAGPGQRLNAFPSMAGGHTQQIIPPRQRSKSESNLAAISPTGYTSAAAPQPVPPTQLPEMYSHPAGPQPPYSYYYSANPQPFNQTQQPAMYQNPHTGSFHFLPHPQPNNFPGNPNNGYGLNPYQQVYQAAYNANTAETEQHELQTRSRSSLSSRRSEVGTPGYHAGMYPQHKRTPSQYSTAERNSVDTANLNFPLKRETSNSSLRSNFSSHSNSAAAVAAAHNSPFATYSDTALSPLPSGTTNSGALAAPLGAQRTPYIYHSPAASSRAPSLERVASGSGTGAKIDATEESYNSEEGSEAISLESKTTAATIEAAMRRRNPGTAAKFVCDLCGETFTRRYNLRGHQRAHRNEKPFKCSFQGCTKAFARSHDCKRHELLHLNVRKYSCEPCKREFVRLDALQRHHRSEGGKACVEKLRELGYEVLI